jgi:hypothetical protein
VRLRCPYRIGCVCVVIAALMGRTKWLSTQRIYA